MTPYKIDGKIHTANDPILRQHGAAIVDFSAELEQLLDQMHRLMAQNDGIGIAAQQVGIALCCCVIDVASCLQPDETCTYDGEVVPVKGLMPMKICNPSIQSSTGQSHYTEGCLSVSEFSADVVRPEFITVKFQDATGAPHTISCDGILARCMQHEFDHLVGILFVDKLSAKGLKKYARFVENRNQGR